MKQKKQKRKGSKKRKREKQRASAQPSLCMLLLSHLRTIFLSPLSMPFCRDAFLHDAATRRNFGDMRSFFFRRYCRECPPQQHPMRPIRTATHAVVLPPPLSLLLHGASTIIVTVRPSPSFTLHMPLCSLSPFDARTPPHGACACIKLASCPTLPPQSQESHFLLSTLFLVSCQ